MVKKIAPVKAGGSAMTQRELARLAGVSMTTIYNVLHQPELVNPETLKSIRKIMDDCDYYPDALAQAMVRGKSNIVGVVVPRFDIQYFADMVCQIERNISKWGYKCLMLQHDDDPVKARDAIRVLRQYRADGIILRCCSLESDVHLAELAVKYQIPFVLLDEVVRGYEAYTVKPDDFEDGRHAAEKLLGLGCRRIAYFGWHRADSDYLGPRFDGCKAALLEHGLEFGEHLYQKSALEYGAGKEEVRKLWERNAANPPDGIVCSNTSIALDVYCCLREFGMDVPDSVKLLGFGGNLYQELLGPRTILSVRHDITRIAENACNILRDFMEHGIRPTQTMSIPSLR